jgi:excisionase family DNA binding protein
MNLPEAAEMLKVHPDTLAAMARDHAVPAYKVGRAWVFSTRLLKQWKPKKRISFRDLMRASEKVAAFADGYQWTDMRGRNNAAARRATPPWANDGKIRAVYAEARARTISEGIKYHVDHVIPLKHELVCGLHVEGNLAIIPATENLLKGNKWRASPGERICPETGANNSEGKP